MQQRDFVLPDDVKALVRPVLSHRIKPLTSSSSKSSDASEILADILEAIPIPGVPHGKHAGINQ